MLSQVYSDTANGVIRFFSFLVKYVLAFFTFHPEWKAEKSEKQTLVGPVQFSSVRAP